MLKVPILVENDADLVGALPAATAGDGNPGTQFGPGRRLSRAGLRGGAAPLLPGRPGHRHHLRQVLYLPVHLSRIQPRLPIASFDDDKTKGNFWKRNETNTR